MIEVKNLIKIYETGDTKTYAVNNISFKINKGEFVAIVGPSGCGKSTLMHILGCLDTPTSGQYFFNNQDVSKLSKDELADIRAKQIGFVFQSFNLLPQISVLKNTILPLIYTQIPKKDREKRARYILNEVNFDASHIYHFSNQLSGGQVQRAAIARALMNNPSIILADEPTGNLDTKNTEIIISLFEELNKRGHTIILITHELEIANRAKRIISMKDGQIINDKNLK
ncbi:MAG TPA: ABC transporter ATP-binding protein [Candidatus Paceibacterota bacterium]|jgi:putative ABC transport system ATP-binding protein|nr:ABC transporter ATP-binding protein [Candidatus Paceibacterota bacterium]HRZ29721.1 ABC transporter ATP-binding protein [Candidatus Paceibacterota bacterium]